MLRQLDEAMQPLNTLFNLTNYLKLAQTPRSSPAPITLDAKDIPYDQLLEQMAKRAVEEE